MILGELGNQKIMILIKNAQTTGCVASRRLERVDDRGVQPQIDRHSQRFVDQDDDDDGHGNDDEILFPKNTPNQSFASLNRDPACKWSDRDS